MANVKGDVMEPITKYSIKTLSSEDYDALPYLHARESAGLTDRFLKVAYIRDTGDVEYDTDTLMHEIDEMTTDKWSHEDKYGVRYKSFFRSFGKTFVGKYVVPAALAMIPGVGLPLAAAYGGINQYQNDSSLRGAATGAVTGLASGIAGQGALGAIGGAIKGGTAAAPGLLSKGAGIISGFGKGLSAGINTGLNKLPGVSGMGQGASAGATGVTAGGAPLSSGVSGSGVGNLTVGGQAFTPMASSAIPNFAGTSSAIKAGLNALNPSVGSGGLQGVGSLGTQAATKTGMSALSKFGVGAATTLAGQFLGPKTPEIPESRFTQMMTEGGLQPRTAIGQQAMQKASELLAQNPQGLSEEYKNAIMADFDKQDAEEERVLKQNYKSLRPYADIENDSAYNKDLADLRQEQSEYRKNTLAKLEQANEESNKTFQRQDIMNAMGIDEQTFNEYASLANQDLNTIMLKTGIDYGEATQFKEMFGKLGSMFISSGLGLDKSSLSDFVTATAG